MVEDGENQNQDGQEGDKDNKPDQASDKGSEVPSDIDRAEKNLEERKKVVEEEKKILDRKEKLAAIQMVGGQTVAGGEEVKPKEETNHEYHIRIKKEMAEGKTDFTKEDGN